MLHAVVSVKSLHATLWADALQASLSVGFSRQEYWSELPCPPPGDLPNPGSQHMTLTSTCTAGRFFTTRTTWEAQNSIVEIVHNLGSSWPSVFHGQSESVSCSVMSSSCNLMACSPPDSGPWNSPGENTGVGRMVQSEWLMRPTSNATYYLGTLMQSVYFRYAIKIPTIIYKCKEIHQLSHLVKVLAFTLLKCVSLYWGFFHFLFYKTYISKDKDGVKKQLNRIWFGKCF